MPEIIGKIFSVVFLVLGLSYLFQAKLWVKLAADVIDRPKNSLLVALLALPFGLLIVISHNVWISDWPIILTILGWLITVKSCLYLLIPQWSRIFAKRLEVNLPRFVLSGGILLTAVGFLLVYHYFLVYPTSK